MTSRFWHPFSNLADAERNPLTVVRGQGAVVYDDVGNEYFDATAGLWYCAAGHGRKSIATAIWWQAAELASYSCFGDYATPATVELADRVAALAPLDDPRVFLTSGGSDGVDSAAKIVRHHFQLRGQPDKEVLLACYGAYHGTHAFGTSLGGIPGNRDGWGDLMPQIAHLPSFDASALERTICSIGPERVAAFFVEPVIGAGGVHIPPDGYLQEVSAICRSHGVLLVCDEVITGIGRLGEWTGSERFGVRPDLMILAKALTSGYQPLGAVVVSGPVVEPFISDGGAVLRHGYTYSGHATACAAALANLDLIEKEGLVDRAAELARDLPRQLVPLETHPLVKEVRRIGLMAAIQLDEQRLADAGLSCSDVVLACRRRGQLTRLLAGGALHFSPPFVSTTEQIDRFAEAVADSLSEITASV